MEQPLYNPPAVEMTSCPNNPPSAAVVYLPGTTSLPVMMYFYYNTYYLKIRPVAMTNNYGIVLPVNTALQVADSITAFYEKQVTCPYGGMCTEIIMYVYAVKHNNMMSSYYYVNTSIVTSSVCERNGSSRSSEKQFERNSSSRSSEKQFERNSSLRSSEKQFERNSSSRSSEKQFERNSSLQSSEKQFERNSSSRSSAKQFIVKKRKSFSQKLFEKLQDLFPSVVKVLNKLRNCELEILLRPPPITLALDNLTPPADVPPFTDATQQIIRIKEATNWPPVTIQELNAMSPEVRYHVVGSNLLHRMKSLNLPPSYNNAAITSVLLQYNNNEIVWMVNNQQYLTTMVEQAHQYRQQFVNKIKNK